MKDFLTELLEDERFRTAFEIGLEAIKIRGEAEPSKNYEVFEKAKLLVNLFKAKLRWEGYCIC